MNSIEIKNLKFAYPGTGEPVVNMYNDHFTAGANVMVIGDNGSGKSTFGKLLCGLLKPTHGSITVCTVNIGNVKSRQRIKLAYYIIQFNQLQFVKNTIAGEIKIAENVTGHKLDFSIIDAFSLPVDLTCNPFELDVNESWRLSLVISAIINPVVLFIDEIPSAANALNKKAISYLLERRREQGKITFVAYQREINLPLFDRQMILDNFPQ